MSKLSKKIFKLTMLSLLILLFQACSVKIPVASPKTSEIEYQDLEKNKKIELQFISNLNKDHNVATGKRTKIFILEHNKKKINAGEYIKLALEKEILARNIALKFTSSGNDKILLEDFEIITHRSSGVSPIVTISTLKVKINIGSETKTFISVVKRAKVPVWSIDEINEPCYNEPVTILVKEVVAKINQIYFGHKFNDQYIEQLQNKISINQNGKLTYLDVYELGFSNNLKSLDFLKTLINTQDEYIRLAAISTIGILGATNQFDFLVQLNKKSKMWQDRAMALKSIGDLDLPKAYKYLKERKKFWQGKTTNEAIWNLKIINLYLQ